ncbi:hypothetical protein HCN44_004170 [Aphidius gifuensis]|uniref:non-specific serine/threonine protein kinase n=1 Tax=Aphidius gifuensis TaxID=684658 RepID=A0A835CUU4_APHGI|nr:serine/threonine-protein kinase Pink1, mitochondrial [Aphidius gifuensis]XP_044002365.1 serine/threonine-protein kinase Pink1, mitochondrial [Aphidius gifuensis]XP_044002366.1 serine/threonine-protein kinase Pink1, mitochondrial [Aphidius gifuensis]KAF7994698.1 hypothetical protein HCN44_004170 [Aphidius gifuensis]
MSIRIIAQRIAQNGRYIFNALRNNESNCTKNNTRPQLVKIHVGQVDKSLGPLPQGNVTNNVTKSVTNSVSSGTTHLGYFGAQARRLFVDSILKRVTNSLASDLRRKACRRLMGGDSAPFFALVGVSLASGTGILTKDDELEGVCWEIREAVSKMQWTKPSNDRNYENSINTLSTSLKNFIIGPLISKGCSAVVYASRLKEQSQLISSPDVPIIETDNEELSKFPYALKMMFNYDAESNALTILKAMYRETVPARNYHQADEIADWEKRMANNKRVLPPHSNIVDMYFVFADRVPMLPGSTKIYPDALPSRLNPEGSGRNMSLFLLMKRYDLTLKEYLNNHTINIRESILLFAQLLEGIAHMNTNGIAHRDLKTDNILLDTTDDTDNCPSLSITDFGCCLADKNHGLYLPYNSHDVDKGGNAALMAPEVFNAEPGPFTKINYTKADLWTAGTIAYELFGMKNPFYGNFKDKPLLHNHNYCDADLPDLPDGVPSIISALVKNILSKSLYKRLSVELASTIMHLHLWAPSSWFNKQNKLPSSDEILQWLLCLTTKVLCEGRQIMIFNDKKTKSSNDNISGPPMFQRTISSSVCGRRTMPEYQLIANFLTRVSLANVHEGLKWIKKNTSIN